MQAIIYYITYPFLYCLALMPMWIQYKVADGIFILLYHTLQYRKKIVIKNLKASFPEKSEPEIDLICKNFYHHLADYIVESYVIMHFSLEELNKRVKFKNLELPEQLAKDKKSIVVLCGHYGNWEWPSNFSYYIPYKILGVYKPLSNKYYDDLIKRIRSKFGTEVVPMEETLRKIIINDKASILTALYLIADQRPTRDKIAHWITFMNQDTPIMAGPEKIVRKMNRVPIFFNINKVKRGYYECEFELITFDKESKNDYEVTEKYFAMLEERIRQKPEFYLWSHNRWKFKK